MRKAHIGGSNLRHILRSPAVCEDRGRRGAGSGARDAQRTGRDPTGRGDVAGPCECRRACVQTKRRSEYRKLRRRNDFKDVRRGSGEPGRAMNVLELLLMRDPLECCQPSTAVRNAVCFLTDPVSAHQLGTARGPRYPNEVTPKCGFVGRPLRSQRGFFKLDVYYYRAGAADVTSSVITLKLVSVHGPNEVTIATSVASRPRAIKMRPIRGLLWRASNVYQRSPR
jgi:hypothetical protein